MAFIIFLPFLLLFNSFTSAYIPLSKKAVPLLRRQANITAACSALNAALPDRVTYPGQSAYETEMQNYWNEGLKSDTPNCIVQPESAQEVSIAITLIGQPDYQGVPFTVKSGGHDPNPGHSAIDNGVIIALSQLNGTTYDAANNVAYVKPGGRWSDVIGALDPYDVTVVGGRLGVVGIGGYLTGGGMSFLSTQYGFACDSFVELETVMPNGTIANINAENNNDLFTVMKGGSNQFGVVTQFTLKTYPMTQVWGGVRAYSTSEQDAILQSLQDYINTPADPKAAVIVNAEQIDGIISAWVIFYFYDGAEPNSAGFSGLLEIPALVDVTQTWSNYADLLNFNAFYGIADETGLRASFRSLTLPSLPGSVGTDFMSNLLSTWHNITSPFLSTQLEAIGTIAFQPIPQLIGAASQASGGNAYVLTASDGPRFIIEQNYLWPDASDDATVYNISTQVTDAITASLPGYVSEAQAQYPNFTAESYLPIFLNDANFEQDVFASWKDVDKMRAVQEQVDPTGFYSNRIGGFHVQETG